MSDNALYIPVLMSPSSVVVLGYGNNCSWHFYQEHSGQLFGLFLSFSVHKIFGFVVWDFFKNLFPLCHFTKLIFYGDPRDSWPFSVPQRGSTVTQNRLLCWNSLCNQLPHFLLIVWVPCLDEAVLISHPLLWELCRPKCHS